MSLQKKVRCCMEDVWCRQEQARFSRGDKKCMQPCSMLPVFDVLVQEWKDCEELKPKAKEEWTFVNKKLEAK